MYLGDRAPAYKQVINRLGDKASIRHSKLPLRHKPHPLSLLPGQEMKVVGSPENCNGIVKPGSVRQILQGKHIFADDLTAFTSAVVAGLVNVGVFKAGDFLPEKVDVRLINFSALLSSAALVGSTKHSCTPETAWS